MRTTRVCVQRLSFVRLNSCADFRLGCRLIIISIAAPGPSRRTNTSQPAELNTRSVVTTSKQREKTFSVSVLLFLNFSSALVLAIIRLTSDFCNPCPVSPTFQRSCDRPYGEAKTPVKILQKRQRLLLFLKAQLCCAHFCNTLFILIYRSARSLKQAVLRRAFSPPWRKNAIFL